MERRDIKAFDEAFAALGTWRLFWDNGTSTDIHGETFPDALRLAGFTAGPPPENLLKWSKVRDAACQCQRLLH
jgi:hypothetical protein